MCKNKEVDLADIYRKRINDYVKADRNCQFCCGNTGVIAFRFLSETTDFFEKKNKFSEKDVKFIMWGIENSLKNAKENKSIKEIVDKIKKYNLQTISPEEKRGILKELRDIEVQVPAHECSDE